MYIKGFCRRARSPCPLRNTNTLSMLSSLRDNHMFSLLKPRQDSQEELIFTCKYRLGRNDSSGLGERSVYEGLNSDLRKMNFHHFQTQTTFLLALSTVEDVVHIKNQALTLE